jgi:xanthine dehydrogenase accessory factor
MDLYEIIAQYLSDAKSGVLATVVFRAGSAPRDAGAKMFIGEDGKTYGTIGGGRLESDTCVEAGLIMGKGETKILHIRMDGREVAEEGMLCGGDVDILLEPVSVKYIEVYKGIGNLEKKGRKGLIVTQFGQNTFLKSLVDYDLEIIGDDILNKDTASLKNYFLETKPIVSNGMVIEPLHVSSMLYIFGAGHVSQHIAKLAKLVDFNVTVVDDREEFANRERFPEADEIIVEDFHRIFNRVALKHNDFVVIVTRGHAYDADVLKETLKRQFRYAGMIGSRRKVKIVFDYLRECGFDNKTIEQVHAPIGLPIHAETPQEIAVSIVAELIQTRGDD